MSASEDDYSDEEVVEEVVEEDSDAEEGKLWHKRQEPIALVEQIRNNTFPDTELNLSVRSYLHLSLSLSLSLLWLISCWFDGQEALLLCHELDKIEILIT